MVLLTLNGKTYTIDQLKNIIPDERQSEFEKNTLKFCHSWLNNQKEFKIQTSGSTGAPKKITLQRSAMETSARMTINALQLKAKRTALICLDTKYVAGQMMLVRSLTLGMNMVAIEPTANPFDHLNQSIDFTALVPYQLENIVSQSPEKLDLIRCAIIGGATVSNSLKEKIKESKCALYATYGMTETISHIALQKLNGVDAQEYFEVIENIGLRLDDRGCLCIKTDHLGKEIITNDLVELIDSRKFKWLGRFDNIINSGGIKIIPEKIESVLEKIFDSKQIKNRFFVTGLPDEKLGQRIVAIFEGSPIQQNILEEILNQAKEHLTRYEIPKEFKFSKKFVDTATGKINRRDSLTTHLQQM